MVRFPFRLQPVEFEFVWQALVVAAGVLAGVWFLRGALTPSTWRRLKARIRLAALVAVPVLAWLAWTLDRLWPAGWPALFILLVAAAVFVLSVLTYRLATRPVRPGLCRMLLGLRTVALFAALMVLLQPAIVEVTETRERPAIYFLYDTSRSMAIKDGADGLSRIEELIRFHAAAEPRLERLARRFTVRRFAFDAELAPLETLSDRPAGPATALGEALRALADRSEGRAVVAVVILSDGSQNSGLHPDRVVPLLREGQAPVYAVGFGQEVLTGRVRDIAVRTILCNAAVFTKNIFPVVAELSVLGLEDENVSLELLFDDKVVDRQDLAVSKTSDLPRVTLSFAPEEIGIHKVTVRAKPVLDELATDNNEASTYVNVLAGGLPVLLVEGQARWEFKFLRRSLEASPDFQVTPALILAPLGPGQRARLAEGLFNWGRYEVIILGDLNRDAFTDAELADLRTAVSEQGKGLMMVGGYESFGPGGWGETPLADALPVRMTRGDGQVKARFQMRPTRLADRHFVLQIEETEAASRLAWERLPELEGASALNPKPAAEVLATGSDGGPLLVAHHYGKGRALAFGADSTWRWAFSEVDSARYHKRFWRQVVLWLARRDKAEGQEMWLTLNKQRLRLGERAQLTAHVQDALGRPIPNCEVEAAFAGPGGLSAAASLTYQDEAYQGTYEPPRRGDYTVTARAHRGGQEIGTAEAKFVVYVPDLELERPTANLDLLRSLASQTGGAFFSPQEADALLSALEARNVPDTVIIHTDIIELWDNFLVILVFLGALTGEWVLRKRAGLI